MMTPAQEWKAMWPLVLAATIGLSGISMFAYSSGIFMDELIGEFGWSRSQYSAAFTLQMLLGHRVIDLATLVHGTKSPWRFNAGG